MRNLTEELEQYIQTAWSQIREDLCEWIWWKEIEMISSFYFRLRPLLENLNKDLNEIKLRIIPEYATKATSYAKEYDNKYPVVKKGQTEYKRAKEVDLCIAAFDSNDLNAKKDDSSITYWYVRHDPLMLMEFKFLVKKSLMEDMKKDLMKLSEIQKKYEGVKRVYFCYLTDYDLSESEKIQMVKKTGVQNLRLCCGTWESDEWNCFGVLT